MASIFLFERTVQLLRDALQCIHEMCKNDIVYWFDLCNSTIKQLNENIEQSNLLRGEKQKCQTCMTHLSCIQVELENCLHHGGSIQTGDTNTIVTWRDN